LEPGLGVHLGQAVAKIGLPALGEGRRIEQKAETRMQKSKKQKSKKQKSKKQKSKKQRRKAGT